MKGIFRYKYEFIDFCTLFSFHEGTDPGSIMWTNHIVQSVLRFIGRVYVGVIPRFIIHLAVDAVFWVPRRLEEFQSSCFMGAAFDCRAPRLHIGRKH